MNLDAELLRRAAVLAMEHPKSFNMDHWASKNEGNRANGREYNCYLEPEELLTECGATSCLAGFVCVAAGRAVPGDRVRYEAELLLKADGEATWKLNSLWLSSNWPKEVRGRAITSVVEDFLETDGWTNIF